MIFKASSKYGDRFAKKLKWFGLLVVEKTWWMCRWKVAVSCEVTCEFKLNKTHRKIFLEFEVKLWLLNLLLSVEINLHKDLSGSVCWLWRKLG
jgi:hypothetical protein